MRIGPRMEQAVRYVRSHQASTARLSDVPTRPPEATERRECVPEREPFPPVRVPWSQIWWRAWS